MSIRSELIASFDLIGRELDAICREVDDLKEYVVKNADRISPMLPGKPRSNYPPAAERDEESHEA
jgi:hypothetical protein